MFKEGVCCGLLGDSCGLSDCGSEVSSGEPAVTDVSDSPSSVVVMSEASVLDSDWEFLGPQSFSFSPNKKACSLLDRYAGRGEV